MNLRLINLTALNDITLVSINKVVGAQAHLQGVLIEGVQARDKEVLLIELKRAQAAKIQGLLVQRCSGVSVMHVEDIGVNRTDIADVTMINTFNSQLFKMTSVRNNTNMTLANWTLQGNLGRLRPFV
jgi:hypothetical protein